MANATYNYKIDSFRIYKAGAPGGLVMEDPFEDGAPPPNVDEVPLPPPGFGTPSYTVIGGMSESDGKLVFDSNNSPLFLGPIPAGSDNQIALNHQLIFNTNIDPTNTSAGLKRNHDFAVEAVFDLTLPDENQQEYGIRFTDTAPSVTPNSIAGLAVYRGTDGRVWVELTEREIVNGTITVKGRIELTGALINGADQIKLKLSHAADTDVVTGKFEFITSDVPFGAEISVGGTAKIFDAATPTENYTRAAVYTTNFNIDEDRAIYQYEVDSFRIEKNGTGNNILVDQFNDGVAPPSINNQGGGSIPGYNVSGHVSEVIEAGGNGLLVMDSARANTFSISGETLRAHAVTAQTNTDNEQNGQGLKSNDDFGAFARFNLILPQEERSEYGIRFTDATGPGTGDDVIALSVRRGVDGVVRVLLTERGLINGTMEILDSFELTPELLGAADQIGLGLTHDADNPGVVSAGFRLFDNGVELPGGPHTLSSSFARIFENEVWTRAQISSGGIDLDGHTWFEGLEGDDVLTGSSADEYFHGHVGNDTIFGGGGTDTVYGGRGNDTVVLSGEVADYAVTSANGVTSLVDNRGGSPDGTINARDVEFFEFANGAFDPALLLTREIEVVGAGANVIVDNDTTPIATDGTAFGSVNLGATLTQVFTINNLGGQSLTITNFKVPAGFTIVSPPPGSIPGGSSATFEVAVNTSTVGPKSGQITFTTNDTTGGENAYNFAISATVLAAPVPEVTVTGTGTQANVNINDNDTAPALTDGTDFSGQELGTAGLIRSFTIRNDGTADLEITNLAISGAGFIEGSGFSDVALAQGEAHIVTVQLDTSIEGAKSAQLTFNTNDPNEQAYNFAIKGDVTATPEIEVSGNSTVISDGDLTPSSDDNTSFGNVLLGDTASRTFTISNTGNAPLTIGALKVPVGFALVGAAPTSIAAGDSATIEVQFVGTKLGLNTGQITFTTNDPTGGENAYNFAVSATVIAAEVTVLGTGTAANQNIVDNDTAPVLTDGTDFGNVELNLDGTERTFTIKNDGTADLVISDLLVSGAYSIVDDLDSTTIAAGGSETFTVKLDTSAPGAKAGAIAFTTNDANEQAYNFAIKGNVTVTPDVMVEGGGTEIVINDLSPSVIDDTDFGTANLGDSGAALEHTFIVTNTGNAPLTVTGPKLPTGFVLVEGLTGPIAPGASDTFTVRLDASKPGIFSGPITFTTNDPDEKAFKFQVAGTVTQPEIDIFGNNTAVPDNSTKGTVTNHTDFGPGIGRDDVDRTRTFTVRNNGTGDLDISAMSLSAGAFTLIDDLSNTTIAAGDSATFDVLLNTSAAGSVTGVVTLLSNDLNESVYNFTLGATVGPRNIIGDDAVDDVFTATGDAESFNGLGGRDTVSYVNATGPITASLLPAAKSTTNFSSGDLFSSIEDLVGSAFKDVLTGSAGNNLLQGGGEADTLNGGSGDDTLDGGIGADKLIGGAGTDTASYKNAASGVTANLLSSKANTGEAAGDTYSAIENLLGSDHNDVLIGNAGTNAINGGDGEDLITGGAGKDTLTGGADADKFIYNLVTEGGDTLADFNGADDKIQIDKSGFKMNAAVDIGTLDAFDFALHYFVSASGGTPTTANPSGVSPLNENGHGQFLFNEDDSKLWWDTDGPGRAKAVLLADLPDGTLLTADTFILVA